LHVGAAHVPALHALDWQSPAIAHVASAAHLPHEPPQSTSVSLPSRTRSKHVLSIEAAQVPVAHGTRWILKPNDMPSFTPSLRTTPGTYVSPSNRSRSGASNDVIKGLVVISSLVIC